MMAPLHDEMTCQTSSIGDKDDDATSIDDKLARMMMKMMGRHAETIGNLLQKRAALVQSICRLAQHVPRCALEDIFRDFKYSLEYNLDNSRSNLPISSIECFQLATNVEATAVSNSSDATNNHNSNNSVAPMMSLTDNDENKTHEFHENFNKAYWDPEDLIYCDEAESDEKAIIEDFKNASGPAALPYATYHDCALLFVDISGFTKISQTLDLDNLSKVINDYFELIVTEVTNHGGDILKVAGDAIFAEWPVIKSTGAAVKYSYRGGVVSKLKSCQSLSEAVTLAALCGARIASTCGNVPIFAPVRGLTGEIGTKTMIGTLNVHCGLGAGEIATIHVGDDTTKREFLVLGDPVLQATKACNVADLREVAASREALSYLADCCSFSDKIQISSEDETTTIAYYDHRYFEPNDELEFPDEIIESPTDLLDVITVSCESMDIPELQDLRLMVALYVHPVVANEEIATNWQLKAHDTGQDRHVAEAELRNIYTIFISPMINAQLTGNASKDRDLFRLLNSTFLVVTRELEKYHGHLRQYIVDDKGVVLIATFGLRGSTCPNMVSERALPCTTAIHNALQVEVGVENQIGGTFGQAYCGIVGGICRHEFAVLGPSVNLSARLMCNAHNPGILVDNKVRLKASKNFSFNALPPVRAKGYVDMVPIFEPISANDKKWGKDLRDFVGRREEMADILQIARQVIYSNESAKFIFIQAESGAGKSSLFVRALSSIRKMAITTRKRLIITRNLSNDSDRLVPFSMFQSCFKGILNEIQGVRGEISSDLSCSLSHSETDSSEDFSSVDSSSSINSTKSGTESDISSAACSTSFDRLAYLVNELNAPPEFLEIVGCHILGIQGKAKATNQVKYKSGSLDEIVDFMARAFIRCTSHADMVVLALDDVHHLDELSWKVVEVIFKLGSNMLIIGASRPLKSYKLEVDPVFWSKLNSTFTKELRFTSITLKALSEIEIRDLAAYKLGARAHEIEKSFYIDLHIRSGGMPHFASQILENIRRNKLATMLPSGKIGWRTNLKKEETLDLNFSTAGELTIHRIDSLDTLVRQVLHTCAVFGKEFELNEVVAVCRGWLWIEESDEDSCVEKIVSALNVAVNEGIIDESYEGGEELKIEDLDDDFETEKNPSDASQEERAVGNIQYRFRHDMWREAILKLLLDSRKREIHSVIADSLEKSMENAPDSSGDYSSMIKLFGHRKASGNTAKASTLALAIGGSFVNIFLNNQAINIYNDALAMWLPTSEETDTDAIAGYPVKVLQSISPQDLQSIVALHIAKAQCLTNVLRHKDGVQAYNDALLVIKNTPASSQIKDRSYSFPLFSGLFFLLKMGKIEQDSECSYERGLVEMFVAETKLHGDPVHYGRSLGMKAEHLARLGEVHEAFDSLRILDDIYDVDKHSVAVCKAYGSDRCAQAISVSVLWNLQLGRVEKARETCDFVLNKLLGKMDLRNVHNTMMILYPIFFVMKDWGHAQKMRKLLNKSIVKPFYEHFGEGGSTPLLILYKPLDMLFEVCQEGEVHDLLGKVDWILEGRNGILGDFIDLSMGTFGRTGASITAEICLHLARRIEDLDKKRQLLAKGTALARRSICICLRDPKMPFAYNQTEPVHKALEEMVVEFDVPEDMITNKTFDYV